MRKRDIVVAYVVWYV